MQLWEPCCKIFTRSLKESPSMSNRKYRKLFFSKNFSLGNMFWTPWPQFWRPHWKKGGMSNRCSARFRKTCHLEFFWKEILFARQSSSGHGKGKFDISDEKSWWKVLKFLLKCWKWSKKLSFFKKKTIFRWGSRMHFWPVCWENLVRSLRNSFTFSTCVFVYLHFVWPMI